MPLPTILDKGKTRTNNFHVTIITIAVKFMKEAPNFAAL
jgi:hypothetical protein